MPDPKNLSGAAGAAGGSGYAGLPDVGAVTASTLDGVRLQRGHAPVSTEDVLTRDQKLPDTVPLGMWGEAWRRMRRRPLFWVSVAIIALVTVVALFPGLFTSVDPRAADLRNSLGEPTDGHPFGFTQQGYDVYSRVIYGARPSVIVGVCVYAFAAVKLKAITRSDCLLLPKGAKIAKFLKL